MNGRGTLLAAAALVSASCGVPFMKLPAGPASAAPDAQDVIAQATSVCRGVSTFTAEISVRGSVGRRRLSGHLSAGLATPASARLEAVAPFGPPLFIFVANGDDATLLLPRDRRALEHGRPEAVLEAIAGVPLDASTLRAVLTGCPMAPEAAGARQLGELWRRLSDGSNDVWVHRDGATAPWRIVMMLHPAADGGWRAEYRDSLNGLPRTIRLTSADLGAPRFDLKLALSQVDINMPLGAEVFRIEMPNAVDAISLDELKQSGPLGTNGR